MDHYGIGSLCYYDIIPGGVLMSSESPEDPSLRELWPMISNMVSRFSELSDSAESEEE